MLFGSAGRVEETKCNQLELSLDSLFDRKLSGLDSKGANLLKELERARKQFDDACSRFERIDVEPETEYFFIDNVNFLKSQKIFYTKALRRILEDWNVGHSDEPTIHGRYSNMLSNTEKFINEVLMANNKFKKVLQSYPNYLDMFKGSFSLIERLAASLKNELNRVDVPAHEYKLLLGQISKLQIMKNEHNDIVAKINELNDGSKMENTRQKDSAEPKVSQELEEKKKELSVANSELYSLHQRITSLTIPLERPSKKFDHISQRKRQLHTIIMDPITNINQESDYIQFIELLKDLKKAVESNTIEVKNASKAIEEISELFKYNIYEAIEKYKTIEKSKFEFSNQKEALEMQLKSIRQNINNSEKAIEDIGSLRNEESKLKVRITEGKRSIEKLFSDYYGKKISIID